MKNIYFRNGVLIYYGNPAGYLSDGKVILDSIFDKGEIKEFLSEKEKLAVEVREGVYDRLSEGGGMEEVKIQGRERRIKIHQLKQGSPLMMRFISLAEKKTGAMENRRQRSMHWFMKEKWKTLVWKRSGRSSEEEYRRILKDTHYPYRMLWN